LVGTVAVHTDASTYPPVDVETAVFVSSGKPLSGSRRNRLHHRLAVPHVRMEFSLYGRRKEWIVELALLSN
jgi:hypothetical protein